MSKTIWILGDQLLLDHPALNEADPDSDRILLIESTARAAKRPYN
ncbi:MAG: cryptochrome/photolyase family protein, partial [Anaerolineae bacterium]